MATFNPNVSNNVSKFLSIKERTSICRADTECKKNFEIIPHKTIQKLYEDNYKTVRAKYPEYPENSVSLSNIIVDKTCLDIIKTTESNDIKLSKVDVQYWLYPLIRRIENTHFEKIKHAVVTPPDINLKRKERMVTKKTFLPSEPREKLVTPPDINLKRKGRMVTKKPFLPSEAREKLDVYLSSRTIPSPKESFFY
jgi:hypothetical protein